jgi:L-aminopeptidase/D-esterase-like protein
LDGGPPLARRRVAHRRARRGGLAVLAALAVSGPAGAEEAAAAGLTAVAGVKVGHHTMLERPTGCTVVLTEAGAVGAVDVRGGAPGTRETDLLDPSNLVERVHAVVLAGGSAFGLDAAGGVVRYLEERGVGFDAGVARVPIVPAAILFDLPVGGDPRIRPTAECGYQAAKSASAGPVAEGNVGAGAGATVGKLLGRDRAMKGGVGSAALAAGDLVVAALVAVNAAGDVVDPETGAVVAGVRTGDGRGLVDVRTLIRSGALLRPPAPAKGHEHTTLGVVATSAALGKAQARKVAQMAHDGLARAVHPAHLPVDGDTLFVLATGASGPGADVGIVGAMAADVVAQAVVRAVRAATGIPGYPAARDLHTAPDP